MLSVLTGVFYTNFKEFYSQNVENLLKDSEHRGLIKKCLQDKILNFEKIKKILNEFLSSKRKTIERMRIEELSEEEMEEVDMMKTFEELDEWKNSPNLAYDPDFIGENFGVDAIFRKTLARTRG